MVLPSTEGVFLIDSPGGFAALLTRDDLSEASAAWWTAAISACSSCLTLATTDDAGAQPIEWARVLVSILEAAASSGLIRKVELLARRVQVETSALLIGNDDFGDASDICAKALGELGDLGESVQSVASEVRGISKETTRSSLRMADLAVMRKIVRMLASVGNSIPEGETRSGLNLWVEAFKLE